MLTPECDWVRKYGRHGEVTVYRRIWWRPWRKVYETQCWGCDYHLGPA